MTLLYERPADGSPGTHALVVGVGFYPHLPGGDPTKLAKNPLGLKQLSSPPVSATALLDYLLAPTLAPAQEGFSNSQAPIASVEAAIAANPAVKITTASGPAAVDPATGANVKAAFSAWLNRLKANSKNIGLLYLCGHGVSFDEDIFLASDFAADNDSPWDNCFNVTRTVYGLQTKVEGPLFIFIDACREVSKNLATQRYGQPKILAGYDGTDPVKCESATVIWSTGATEKAFADPNQVSRFSAALLTALKGYAGKKVPAQSEWHVTGAVLAEAVRGLLKLATDGAERQVIQQTVTGDPRPLVTRSTAPKVKVRLGVVPADKCGTAKWVVTSTKGVASEVDCSTGHAEADLIRGFYDMAIISSANEFPRAEYPDQDVDCPVFALPPHQVKT